MVASLPACRLILDPQPRSGAWNMAVDELLLESAVNDDACSLRWYGWDCPTVSLGYFQDAEAVAGIADLAGLPVVRRLSGGGAIVHDQELTYSCAIPATHPFASQPRELYIRVHERVIAVLAEFGVCAGLRGTDDKLRNGAFLCFGRGDSFDVVVGSEKILGSAQRRRKGAILQHGSLVLRRSSVVPQFPGVLDFAARRIDIELLRQRLSEETARLLSNQVASRPLSVAEVEAAGKLADKCYGACHDKNSR